MAVYASVHCICTMWHLDCLCAIFSYKKEWNSLRHCVYANNHEVIHKISSLHVFEASMFYRFIGSDK